MSNNEFYSSHSEDLSSKLRAIVNYAKETRANCLNLQTMPRYDSESALIDFQPIFDALVGSEITEINLGKMPLTHKIQGLSKVLSKTAIETLTLEFCSLELDDILSLMACLKDTRVTTLDISGNCAMLEDEHIDEFISHLAKAHLRILNLSGNSILPFEKVARFFQTLPETQITCLDFSSAFRCSVYSCPLKLKESLLTLTSSLRHSAVTNLVLGSNKLDDFVVKALGAILEHSKLERLDLCDNNITDSGVDFLIPGLIRSKITHLNLRANKISGDNSLGRFLKDTKLKELNLSHNRINDGRIFSAPFLQGSVVDCLKLSNCCNGTNEIIPLPITELKCSELTFLDLSYNNLGLDHITALADVLIHSKLTHVNLFGNHLSEECFDVLGECLKQSNLQHLNLCHTASMHWNFHSVASFLANSKGSSLVSVNLSGNGLGFDGKVMAAVLENSPLLALGLSYNLVEGDIISLAKQLKFTAITDLNLCNNGIGDEGVTVLATCLKDTRIVILDLRSNSITSQGAVAMSLALKESKLRHLNLRQNGIENDGLESLAEHAKNSCITYLNVECNAGDRKLLIDCVMWENRKKIQQFADLLKQTALLTGASNMFEFGRDLDLIHFDNFIDDCLRLYKMVSEEPYVVDAIEQDKCILQLKAKKCFEFRKDFCDSSSEVFVEDCESIYNKIVEQPSLVKNTLEQGECVSFFRKHILWLILEEFPRKLASFIGRDVEADVTQHVSLLRKVEEQGLSGIVELLLLNRPLYVIDESQGILHPYVCILLEKYKQPICNLEIEPTGVDKIVKYFTKHTSLDGASEVISLLTNKL